MRNNRVDRPLGKILHIINGEAITRPENLFIGKGAKVVLEDLTEIGVLGDPFGQTKQPFQPIKLNEKLDKLVLEEIVGMRVFAQVKRKRSRRRRRKN